MRDLPRATISLSDCALSATLPPHYIFVMFRPAGFLPIFPGFVGCFARSAAAKARLAQAIIASPSSNSSDGDS
jgi:hypothetical protein